MILIKDLSVSYNKKSQVINGLNLELEDSSINGIVGLNGSGKTTLLNAIFGLLKADNGEIINNNTKINKIDISYLPTENYFYTNITGIEYLSLFNNNFDIEKWNELFALPLDKLIDTYSTGMKKKLALIGIIKQNKPIIILDEPFNGLDIESSRIIRSILLKLRTKGKTIIITSHILETLTNMCDKIHYLDQGKIKYNKNKSEFSEFEKEIFSTIEDKNKDLIKGLI